MDAQLTCNIIFPPQANKYQVSLDSQNILVSPHPANHCGLGLSETWTIPTFGNNLTMALDLDHPILHWLQKVKRHYKVKGVTDIDNSYFEACGNLMEKKTVQNIVNSENILEESDIAEDNGEIKPPQVEDNFTPHQLKAKRRRASLPNRFQ